MNWSGYIIHEVNNVNHSNTLNCIIIVKGVESRVILNFPTIYTCLFFYRIHSIKRLSKLPLHICKVWCSYLLHSDYNKTFLSWYMIYVSEVNEYESVSVYWLTLHIHIFLRSCYTDILVLYVNFKILYETTWQLQFNT